MARPHTDSALTGQVDNLNHDGWGVVRAGKTVFVAGALPGETVEYRVRRRQRNFDEAELLQVIEPAADRIAPGCAHFGTCGGCALQHLAPESQLRFKDSMLRETLRRIGKVEPLQWIPPLSGDPWGYRRRARLGARFVHAKGRSMVGFRERLSSYVADIGHCPVLVPAVGNLIGDLSALVTRLSIPTRIPQIEVAVGDDAVVLVMRTLSPLSEADREALLQFEKVHNVRWLLQPGGPSTVQALQGEIPSLWYALPEFGLRLSFEPADFIQVNGDMNRRLISHVLELMQLDRGSDGPGPVLRPRQLHTADGNPGETGAGDGRGCRPHRQGRGQCRGQRPRERALRGHQSCRRRGRAALPRRGRCRSLVPCPAGSPAHRRQRYPPGTGKAGPQASGLCLLPSRQPRAGPRDTDN